MLLLDHCLGFHIARCVFKCLNLQLCYCFSKSFDRYLCLSRSMLTSILASAYSSVEAKVSKRVLASTSGRVSTSVSTSVLQTVSTVRQCLDIPIAHFVTNSPVSKSYSFSASILTCASASSLPSLSPIVDNYLDIGIQMCHKMSQSAPRLRVPLL